MQNVYHAKIVEDYSLKCQKTYHLEYLIATNHSVPQIFVVASLISIVTRLAVMESD